MLKYDGKEFRNLEEQVLKNKSDIEYLFDSQGVLNEFGIKVVGVVADEIDLPASADDYGDAYAVGVETPYSLYIWTRANNVHPNDYWFNIGEFPLQGPQGPVGPTGPRGETGERGIQGPQGVQGIQGIAGPQGPQGPQGAQGVQGLKGDKGDAGNSFRVVGTLSNVNQLPTPSVEIQSDAYLVTIVGAYHLYIITGEDPNLLWTDCGRIEGVQGPQGPQGIQGPQGPKGDTGDTGPKGDQGIQGPQGAQGNTGATGNGIASIAIDNGTAVTGGTQYVMTITYTNGTTATQTFIALTGAQGPQGIQGEQGPQGVQGETGATGPQGPKGDAGAGLPSGGTTGQYLKKKTNSDYDTEWYTLTFDNEPTNNSSNPVTSGGVYNAINKVQLKSQVISDLTTNTSYSSLNITGFTLNKGERLHIEICGRTSGNCAVWLRVNDISTNTYDAQRTSGTGSSLVAALEAGYDAVRMNDIANYSYPSIFTIDIELDNSGMPAMSYHNGNYNYNLTGTAHNTTTLTSITSVQIFPTGGPVWVSGTHIRVWKEYTE